MATYAIAWVNIERKHIVTVAYLKMSKNMFVVKSHLQNLSVSLIPKIIQLILTRDIRV